MQQSNIARRIAEIVHKDQKYGPDTPFIYHLIDVACTVDEIVTKYTRDSSFYKFGKAHHDICIAIAYLHDALEDGDNPKEILERMEASLDKAVVNGVKFITDVKEGKNREERKSLTYKQMRSIFDSKPDGLNWNNNHWIRLAVIVKLADRISNLKAGIASNHSLVKEYINEAAEFESTIKYLLSGFDDFEDCGGNPAIEAWARYHYKINEAKALFNYK